MKLIYVLFGLFITISSKSYATGKPEYPEHLNLVGESHLSFLWWEIYDAELFSLDGRFTEAQRPIMVSLTYLRDITRKELLEETQRQWRHAKISTEQSRRWLNQLEKLWPNVTQNDSIAFFIDTTGNCHFYFNRQFIGSITDPEFSRDFANIWLAKNSAYPELTRQLTGQN